MLTESDELDRHDRLKDMLAALQAPLSRWSDELNKITDQLDSKCLVMWPLTQLTR